MTRSPIRSDTVDVNRRHACPVTGCRAVLPHSILMCRRHWKAVPRPEARAVVRAWREGPWDAYLAARRAAVIAVHRVLGLPSPGPDLLEGRRTPDFSIAEATTCPT